MYVCDVHFHPSRTWTSLWMWPWRNMLLCCVLKLEKYWRMLHFWSVAHTRDSKPRLSWPSLPPRFPNVSPTSRRWNSKLREYLRALTAPQLMETSTDRVVTKWLLEFVIVKLAPCHCFGTWRCTTSSQSLCVQPEPLIWPERTDQR